MSASPEPCVPPSSPPLPPPHLFVTSDGYETSYRLWTPPARPRALIVALHGIQSHAGWYGWSSARLAEAGYLVAFLDRRGSGANSAARGDTPHPERLVSDVLQFAAHLGRRGYGALPRVLAAVSWGAKVAVATASRGQDLFSGIALTTPGLCAQVRANSLQQGAIRAADAAGLSRRPVAIPLDDPALFTDDPACREFIRTDDLTLRTVSVRFLAASLSLDRLIRERAAEIRCPILTQLAGRDRIVDNAATRALLTRFGARKKSVVEYASARHTLEFEPNREEIFDDLVDWLERVISTEPGNRNHCTS